MPLRRNERNSSFGEVLPWQEDISTPAVLGSAHPEMKFGHELVSNSEVDDFFKFKSKIPDFERGKSRNCTETCMWYIAQAIPQTRAPLAY